MTRHPGLAGLLSLLAIIGAVATRAAGEESKKLDGYTAVVVGEFTVDKGPATEGLPEGIAPLVRTKTIENLRAQKIFPQVYENEPATSGERRLILSGIILPLDQVEEVRSRRGLEVRQARLNVRFVLRDEQTGSQLLSFDCRSTLKSGWSSSSEGAPPEGALDAAEEIVSRLIDGINMNRAREAVHRVYVISENPPAVTILSRERWDIVGTVALSSQGPSPKAVLVSPNSKYLYVFRGYLPGEKGGSEAGWLEAVDLESRSAGKMIPLGWNLGEIAQSKDGRRILLFARGEIHTTWKRTRELRQPALFTVIDADTNQVLSTTKVRYFAQSAIPSDDGSRVLVMAYRQGPGLWYKSPLVALVFRAGDDTPLSETDSGPASVATVSPGGKWFYVLDPHVTVEECVWTGVGHDTETRIAFGQRSVHVLNAESGKQARVIEAGYDSRPGAVFTEEKTDTAGVLSWYSAADTKGSFFRITGEDSASSEEVGEWPLYTVRFDGQPGVFIVSHEDLRFLSDASKKIEYRVALNPKFNAKGEPGRKYLDGWPAVAPPLFEGSNAAVPHAGIPCLPQQNPVIVYLPQQNKMAMMVGNQKVAILDLASRQVQSVTPIGRSGVKAVKVGEDMARVAAASAFTVGAGALTYGVAGGAIFGPLAGSGLAAPNLSPGNMRQTGLSASPNGEFIYARDAYTHDVNILKSEDGSIVHMVGLAGDSGPDYLCSDGILSPGSVAKGACAGATGMAPGGQQLYSLSRASLLSSEIAFINTQTNEKTKHDIPGGANLLLMGPERRVLVLGTSKLLVFNAETGEQLTEVKGLTDAKLLVASPPPASENEKPAQPAGRKDY